MQPSKKLKRQFGGLVFDFGTVTAASSDSATVRNNRELPFVVRQVHAVCLGGADSHGDWTIQVRDQATGWEWFSSAAQLSALVGGMIATGIAAADQGSAAREPWSLPTPYVLESGSQLLITAYNNGAANVPLTVILSGFYGED